MLAHKKQTFIIFDIPFGVFYKHDQPQKTKKFNRTRTHKNRLH